MTCDESMNESMNGRLLLCCLSVLQESVFRPHDQLRGRELPHRVVPPPMCGTGRVYAGACVRGMTHNHKKNTIYVYNIYIWHQWHVSCF
jgi:hypothetical protein